MPVELGVWRIDGALEQIRPSRLGQEARLEDFWQRICLCLMKICSSSGGQGRWYSRTLEMLFPGARGFVNIPGTGYVGVGEVTEESQPVKEFTVELNGEKIPILDVPDLRAPKL